ncbi:hypothetical protein EDM56_28015 [Brevibacillus fluminis]|uniref:Uncharacterized protein n=1 Tax=Brevibacillus fluminis TaxID=511487 RepID=A0A3M8CWS6_9BACL|nr:hypothetical protein [Brevibacillus fluminis]RNB80250.1 hypothetical protein EDM56_28015 [Brevibacillus fluminis]
MMTETVYGPNHQQVHQLMTRLSEVPWFSVLGNESGRLDAEKALKECTHHLNLEEFEIVWMTREQIPSFIENMNLSDSHVWSRIQDIPKKLSEKAIATRRQSVLDEMLDLVPEMLFHKAYDGAFPALHEYGERVVKVAVVSVLYLFSNACLWEALSDKKDSEPNPFLPLLKVYEAGHWPIGMVGNQFYLI